MIQIKFVKGKCEILETNPPVLGKGTNFDVLIKVLFSGLCGSDIHRIKNFQQNKLSIPTLGHEIVGVVEDSKSTQFSKGDFVVAMPIINCSNCINCKKGHSQFCENPFSIGKNTDGGFSEYLLMPGKSLYKIDKPIKEYVLTDPFACVLHTENLIGKLKNKKICIIGDGAISEIAVRYFSLNNKIVNLVKNMPEGADKYGKRIRSNNNRIIKTYSNYFDVVFECVGGNSPDLINFSADLLNVGGKLVVLGVYDKDFYSNIYLRNLFYKEIQMVGANSFIVNDNVNEFKDSLTFIKNNPLIFSDIITHELPLSKFNEGIEIFKNKQLSRAKKIVFF